MRPILPHKPQPLRSEQIILFRAGGQLFAISSASVQEVRSIESVTITGRTVSRPEIPKVQHFVQRGEASLYVVNAAMHFGLAPEAPELVFVLRRTRTALLVDGIDRMASMTRLQALPQSFCHEEREWYRGLTALDQSIIPVIKPEGVLTEDQLFALDATMLQNHEAKAAAAANKESGEALPDSGFRHNDASDAGSEFDASDDASMMP
jgi:chemotaxis signal transduction protein